VEIEIQQQMRIEKIGPFDGKKWWPSKKRKESDMN
jgi:hypothetical protein